MYTKLNTEEHFTNRRNHLGIAILGFLTFIGIVLLYNYPTSSSLSSQAKEHYAIVVDAGSSGSRCFLYHWPDHPGAPDQLLKITPLRDENGEPFVQSATPGISSFGDNPEQAFEYIKPLMQFAANIIPSNQHDQTPLFILATAGMRLIETSQQEAIMKNVRQGIQSHFKFHFPDNNLEVITGIQEGIYQWLAINYVLNRFDQLDEVHVLEDHNTGATNEYIHPGTVGAVDMGGASTQIAVEVPNNLLDAFSEKEKSKVVEVNLGCRESDKNHRYRLFVKSFLGYGANEAISRYHRHLILSQFEKDNSDTKLLGSNPEQPIPDPCLPVNLKENITVDIDLEHLANDNLLHKLKGKQVVYLSGIGDWDRCYEILSQFTKSSEPYLSACDPENPGCPDNGIKMPPIPLEHTDFYGFSEFWYTAEDVVHMGGKFSYDTFSKASRKYCAGEWDEIQKNFEAGKYVTHDLFRLKTQCIKSAWLAVAVHEGFKFPKNYDQLTSAPNAVNGQVVHWTIGALLYRTRFYPLRTIQETETVVETVKLDTDQQQLGWDYQLWHYIVLFGLALVLTSGFIYLKRFKRYVKPSAMRKVESLAFLRNSVSPSSSNSSMDLEKGHQSKKTFEPSIGIMMPKL